MRPRLALACGMVVLACLGGVYSWSAFASILQDRHGLSAVETQSIFGTLFAVFTMAMAVAGRFVGRLGPRPLVRAAGVLFGGGFVLAGLSQGRFAPMLLGIGLACGAGVGMAYVSVLTAVVAGFPRRRGLATGLIAAAFGGGAIVMSQVHGLLSGWGLGLMDTFRVIGIGYGAAILLASWGLPRLEAIPTESPGGCPVRSWSFADPAVRRLCLGMLAGTFVGMLIIGNLAPIVLEAGQDPRIALWAITVFAAGNATGRVVWGLLHDRLGYRTLPLAMLTLAGAAVALRLGGSAGILLASTLAVGFSFGACFVLYPAQVAKSFGPGAVATLYPAIFLFYGLSSLLGPLMGGFVFDTIGSYTPALTLAAGVALAGTVGLWRAGRLMVSDTAPHALASRTPVEG